MYYLHEYKAPYHRESVIIYTRVRIDQRVPNGVEMGQM